MSARRAQEAEVLDKSRMLSEQDLELATTLTELLASGSPSQAPAQPRLRETLLNSWQASIASSLVSLQGDERSAGRQPSPTKRYQPQVVKTADGRYQCFDGTIRSSQASAYRYTKGAKAASMEPLDDDEAEHGRSGGARRALDTVFSGVASGAASPLSTTTTPWRERQLKVLDHVVDVSAIKDREPTCYDLARAWTLHAARMPTLPQLPRRHAQSLSAVDLEEIVAQAAMRSLPSKARPTRTVDWTLDSVNEHADIKKIDDIWELRARYLSPFKRRRTSAVRGPTTPS